jgi:GNAT superfamily N-acetyltransferase
MAPADRRLEPRLAASATAPATVIREAKTAQDIAQARALFEEYAAWLAVDLCFQGFACELATLPGNYAPPLGCLLLAGPAESPLGCVALRPCAALPGAAGSVGEVKRLYVRSDARGCGIGGSLVRTLIDRAWAIGYTTLVLDTLEQMGAARSLYASLGFREIPAYYANPLPGVRYMALDRPREA